MRDQVIRTSLDVQPVVYATIQTDQWNLSSETAGINSSLSVLVGSILILTCAGNYPLKWVGNYEKKSIQEQKRVSTNMHVDCLETDNTKLEGNKTLVRREDRINKFPIMDRYTDKLIVQNFSMSNTGLYTCARSAENTVISSVAMATTVNISGHTISEGNTGFIQILQCGFTNVTIHQACSKDSDQTIATCIHAIPEGPVELEHTLIANGQNYTTSANQSILFQMSEVPYGRPIMLLESVILKTGLGRLRWSVFTGYRNTSGKASFDFVLRSNNGSIIGQHSEHFELTLLNLLVPWEEPVDAHAYLMKDGYHNIDIQMLKVNPNSTGDLSWAVRKKVADKSRLFKCAADDQWLCAGTSAVTTCGILSVTRLKHMYIMGVRRFTNDYKNESIQIKNLESPIIIKNGYAFLDVLPAGVIIRVSVIPQQPCFVDLFQEPSIRRNFTIVIFDPPIFGDRFNKTQIATMPKNVRSGSELFLNDTFILRCLVPTCFIGSIAWCKLIKKQPECQFIYWMTPQVKTMVSALQPTYDLGFYDHSNTTVAYDMAFRPITFENSGRYICELGSSWGLLGDSFDSVVEQPAKPAFDDGEDSRVRDIHINKGTTVRFSCKPNGKPTPSIFWSYENGGADQSIENFDDSIWPYITNDNATLEVNRPGLYQCNATNRFGTAWRKFRVQYNAEPVYWPIGIAVAVVTLGFVGLATWLVRRRNLTAALKRLAISIQDVDMSESNQNEARSGDQVQQANFEDWKYEILITDLILGQQLGKGEFGLVRKARLKSLDQREVAVKMPADSMSIRHFKALVAEWKVLAHSKPHVNVLGLVAACTSRLKQGELCIVMDLCELGTLRDYLIKHKSEFENPRMNTPMQFTKEMLLDYSCQAGNGLAHLANQNIIHRDIALRNLLLTSNHVVKVSDFGLSKIEAQIYNKKFVDCDKMPLHWMAPESIVTGAYAVESDVWSYGILLWEMFSCGRHPTPDIDDQNRKNHTAFVQWLQEGNRLYPPRLAHNEMYHLMRQCWDEDPAKRPTFAKCKEQIEELMNSTTANDMYGRMAQEWSEQSKLFQERRRCRLQQRAPGALDSAQQNLPDDTALAAESLTAPLAAPVSDADLPSTSGVVAQRRRGSGASNISDSEDVYTSA